MGQDERSQRGKVFLFEYSENKQFQSTEYFSTLYRARESGNSTGASSVAFSDQDRAVALSLDDLQGVFYLGALALGFTAIVFAFEWTCGASISKPQRGTFST